MAESDNWPSEVSSTLLSCPSGVKPMNYRSEDNCWAGGAISGDNSIVSYCYGNGYNVISNEIYFNTIIY